MIQITLSDARMHVATKQASDLLTGGVRTKARFNWRAQVPMHPTKSALTVQTGNIYRRHWRGCNHTQHFLMNLRGRCEDWNSIDELFLLSWSSNLSKQYLSIAAKTESLQNALRQVGSGTTAKHALYRKWTQKTPRGGGEKQWTSTCEHVLSRPIILHKCIKALVNSLMLVQRFVISFGRKYIGTKIWIMCTYFLITYVRSWGLPEKQSNCAAIQKIPNNF
jgi:hypothetical protein